MLPLNLCQMVFDQSINQQMYAYTPYETRVQPTISETDEIQQQDDASTTPSFCLRNSKVSLGNGLVSISATCPLEGTYSNLTFCSSTCSRRKWYLIGICLVFECTNGFFEMLIVLVLSHRMEIGGVQVIWKSCKVCIIQRSCVQQDATATYFALAVDKAIELCFLLNQNNNMETIQNAPPLMLFLSSTLLAQSASVYAWRVRYASLGYHSPKS